MLHVVWELNVMMWLHPDPEDGKNWISGDEMVESRSD